MSAAAVDMQKCGERGGERERGKKTVGEMDAVPSRFISSRWQVTPARNQTTMQEKLGGCQTAE